MLPPFASQLAKGWLLWIFSGHLAFCVDVFRSCNPKLQLLRNTSHPIACVPIQSPRLIQIQVANSPAVDTTLLRNFPSVQEGNVFAFLSFRILPACELGDVFIANSLSSKILYMLDNEPPVEKNAGTIIWLSRISGLAAVAR